MAKDRSGFSAPEQTESLAMPTDQGVRLDHDEGVPPVEPSTQSGHDPARRVRGPMGFDPALLKQGELFSQEEVFGGQSAARPETE